MSEITDFALILLPIAGGPALAILSTRVRARLPLPTPGIFLLAAAVVAQLFPAVGESVSSGNARSRAVGARGPHLHRLERAQGCRADLARRVRGARRRRRREHRLRTRLRRRPLLRVRPGEPRPRGSSASALVKREGVKPRTGPGLVVRDIAAAGPGTVSARPGRGPSRGRLSRESARSPRCGEPDPARVWRRTACTRPLAPELTTRQADGKATNTWASDCRLDPPFRVRPVRRPANRFVGRSS